MGRYGNMNDSDNRHIARDSLFILAELRLDGHAEEHRVKVRNLSAGGMMGEGEVRVIRGDKVAVNLRHVGWIDGLIAWVQDNRFGVAFAVDVDPKVVRAPLPGADADASAINRRFTPMPGLASGPVRKII